MAKLDKAKGGRHEILTIEAKKRLVKGGKICTICKEVRKLDEYYTTSTICKFCMNKNAKIRYKKQKQPLW